MTLQEIINECPIQDLSLIEVWVEANPAYDFKGTEDSILVISQPFGDSVNLDTLNLQEIQDFAKELDFPQEDVTLYCEYEMVELKSCEWHENKLTLYFS